MTEPNASEVNANKTALLTNGNEGRVESLRGARNNSMKGVTGFIFTSQAILPPNISFLYIIGVRKNKACKATVIMYWRSLKNTVVIATISAMPKVKKNNKTKATGIKSNAQESFPPITRIITKRAKKESALSTNAPIPILRGKRLLGR